MPVIIAPKARGDIASILASMSPTARKIHPAAAKPPAVRQQFANIRRKGTRQTRFEPGNFPGRNRTT